MIRAQWGWGGGTTKRHPPSSRTLRSVGADALTDSINSNAREPAVRSGRLMVRGRLLPWTSGAGRKHQAERFPHPSERVFVEGTRSVVLQLDISNRQRVRKPMLE